MDREKLNEVARKMEELMEQLPPYAKEQVLNVMKERLSRE
jgi:hypothetical protein